MEEKEFWINVRQIVDGENKKRKTVFVCEALVHDVYDFFLSTISLSPFLSPSRDR